jgi:polyketide cyclase/dehydrase/lipid transport protein
MTVVRFGVDVEATPEEAWAVVSDPRNLPHWDRHIIAVTGVPPGGLDAGVRYVTEMRFVAVRARIVCRVVEWVPPTRGVTQLEGLVDASVSTTITQLRGDRCRLEHEVDYRFRGGALGGIAARSLRLVGGAQLALRHGTVAQKREIERGARPGP